MYANVKLSSVIQLQLAQVLNSSESAVFFFKLTANQALVFDWITDSSQVNLL